MYSFCLKSLFVYLKNHIKDEVSLIHPLWKIECNSITIHKHTHFIFSLESLAISLYNNIFNLMPTYKVCQENDHYWKSHILANSQNSNTQILIYSIFLNLWQKLYMPAKFYANTIKNKILDNFFTFWKWQTYLNVVKKKVV